MSTMYSYETVSDGKFHTLEMLVNKRNFTMRIDGGRSRTILNDGENENIDLDEPVFLGGLPEDVNSRAIKKWHIRHSRSFTGTPCCFL